MRLRILFILLLLGALTMSYAVDTLNDYRSVSSGTWATISTWQRYDGTAWVAATAAPTNTENVITIRNGHVVTVAAARTVDQVVIEATGQLLVNTGIILTLANGTANPDMIVYGLVKNAGTVTATGTLQFANGAKYQHNWVSSAAVGTIPTATWSDGSTCEIINMVGTGNTTKLQGADQSFYDFTWNTTGQTNPVYVSGTSFRPVRNNFTMVSTGTSLVEVSGVEGVDAANARFEFTNYIQTGGTFQIKRTGTTNNAPYTVNIAGDFTMSGGNLQSTTTGLSSLINFKKTGTQTFTKTGGTISTNINFFVKSGATLDMGTSVLTGSGNFTLESGAGLITANTAGISSSGATGSVRVTGTRSYNAAANYTYNGASAQITGSGLTTANNVTINNASGVTLTNGITVNGVLTQTAGNLIGTNAVDGYAAVAYKYINIGETGNNIAGFAVTMTTPTLYPDYVNRQWAISGTYTGSKSVTFYWTDADDNNFNWAGKTPAVWKGATSYTGAYDVSGATNWITVSIPNSLSKGDYVIGPENGDTLPIELTAFHASMVSNGTVKLSWITQSETGVIGYYIYRGVSDEFSSSVLVSPLIDASNSSQETTYSFVDNELPGDGSYYYWLQNLDINGSGAFHGPVIVLVDNSDLTGTPVIPVVTRLNRAYPNPFNPEISIPYELEKADNVRIEIFNIKGQKIRTLQNDYQYAGHYKLVWNGKTDSGSSSNSGIYYVKMVSGNYESVHKIVMTK